MTHTQPAVKLSNRIISGIIPSHQRRVLMLHAQGLRPGQIANTLRLPVGGASAVCDVLRHYGCDIALLPPRRLAS
jgi:hypothetical protein